MNFSDKEKVVGKLVAVVALVVSAMYAEKEWGLLSTAENVAGCGADEVAKVSTKEENTGGDEELLSVIKGQHVVKKDEYPASIARKYGVSMNELLKLNHLGRSSIIYPGQMLEIPQKGRGS